MTARRHAMIRKISPAEFTARALVLIVYVGILCWLSLTSTPPQLPGVLGWDKLLHAGAYGLLSVLVAQVLFCLTGSSDSTWWYAWFTAVCFGALLELLQLLAHTGRTAEWWDLCADALGASLSCVIFRQVLRLYSRHHEQPGAHDG